MNLAAHVDSGLVTVIDAMAHVVSASGKSWRRSQKGLHELHEAIRRRLDFTSDQRLLFILDDLATMEWIGIPVEEIARFARVLCALCRQVYCIVIGRFCGLYMYRSAMRRS